MTWLLPPDCLVITHFWNELSPVYDVVVCAGADVADVADVADDAGCSAFCSMTVGRATGACVGPSCLGAFGRCLGRAGTVRTWPTCMLFAQRTWLRLAQ